jgi:hypothetical protein
MGGINFPMIDADTAIRNMHDILLTLEDREHSTKEEKYHAGAILCLILTLPVAQIGAHCIARFRMRVRVKRLHFVREAPAGSFWPRMKARAIFTAALNMYHVTPAERKWWDETHRFVYRVMSIIELTHHDLRGYFLELIWGILCAEITLVAVVPW